jgi:hypothetical protein
LRRAISIDRWSDQHQDATAHLIAAAYQGHVDSSINDQYRTVIAGARRFLHNIVQYPGCGAFFRPASFAAFEPSRGRSAASRSPAWFRRIAAISRRSACRRT